MTETNKYFLALIGGYFAVQSVIEAERIYVKCKTMLIAYLFRSQFAGRITRDTNGAVFWEPGTLESSQRFANAMLPFALDQVPALRIFLLERSKFSVSTLLMHLSRKPALSPVAILKQLRTLDMEQIEATICGIYLGSGRMQVQRDGTYFFVFESLSMQLMQVVVKTMEPNAVIKNSTELEGSQAGSQYVVVDGVPAVRLLDRMASLMQTLPRSVPPASAKPPIIRELQLVLGSRDEATPWKVDWRVSENLRWLLRFLWTRRNKEL